MKRTVTSDPLVDVFVQGALIPLKGILFLDLLNRAQEIIDILARSLFFRRYIAEKIAKSLKSTDGVFPFLKLTFCDDQLQVKWSEWLVLTRDYKIKFWLCDQDPTADNLHAFESAPHDGRFLCKADELLRRLQDKMGAMRTLISIFGPPSFTIEDIDKEMKQNGVVRLVVFDSPDPSISDADGIIHIITNRLEKLQFTVEQQQADYIAPTLDNFSVRRNEQVLFVINCLPLDSANVLRLYSRMPNDARKRLWIGVHNTGYESYGYTPELLSHPWYTKICEMDDITLLALLDRMFDD